MRELKTLGEKLISAGRTRADAAERFSFESESLVSWANQNRKWLIDSDAFARAVAPIPVFDGGSEHLVFWRQSSGRVVKVTRGPGFGLKGFLVNYIDNILMSNHLFGDDIRFEGVLCQDSKSSLVTSQPFIEGRSPTLEEVTDWFTQQGYKIAGHLRWRNPSTGVEITDAHTGNFVVWQERMMIPIDLQVYDPGIYKGVVV